MSQLDKPFHLRRPYRTLENMDISASGQPYAGWNDLVKFIARLRPEEVVGFRVEVNLRPSVRERYRSTSKSGRSGGKRVKAGRL